MSGKQFGVSQSIFVGSLFKGCHDAKLYSHEFFKTFDSMRWHTAVLTRFQSDPKD